MPFSRCPRPQYLHPHTVRRPATRSSLPNEMGRPTSPQFSADPRPVGKKPLRTRAIFFLATLTAAAVFGGIGFCYTKRSKAGAMPSFKFYASVTRPRGICLGVQGDASSYAGYIGLEGDTADSHRRSFFWWLPASLPYTSFLTQSFRLFEAEENASNAPIM